MNFSMLAALEPYEIVIIVVVAAVFVGIIIAALIFTRRRKRSVDETVLESRDEVSENAHTVQVLKALAEGKSEVIAALDELYDKLLYLTPSADDEVAVIDEKIKNALGDIKIELTKTQGKDARRPAGGVSPAGGASLALFVLPKKGVCHAKAAALPTDRLHPIRPRPAARTAHGVLRPAADRDLLQRLRHDQPEAQLLLRV